MVDTMTVNQYMAKLHVLHGRRYALLCSLCSVSLYLQQMFATLSIEELKHSSRLFVDGIQNWCPFRAFTSEHTALNLPQTMCKLINWLKSAGWHWRRAKHKHKKHRKKMSYMRSSSTPTDTIAMPKCTSTLNCPFHPRTANTSPNWKGKKIQNKIAICDGSALIK